MILRPAGIWPQTHLQVGESAWILVHEVVEVWIYRRANHVWSDLRTAIVEHNGRERGMS